MTAYVNSKQISIPAKTSGWGTVTIDGASVLSVGLQNADFQTRCYPTQLFINTENTVCYQVDNLNCHAVEVSLRIVTDKAASVGDPGETGSKKLG